MQNGETVAQLKAQLEQDGSKEVMSEDEKRDFSQMVECCFKSHYWENFNMDNEWEGWIKCQEMIQMIENFNDPDRKGMSEMTKEQFEDRLIEEVLQLIQTRNWEKILRWDGDILQQFLKGLKYMQDTYFKDNPEKIDPLGNYLYQIKEHVQRYAYL